MYRCEPRPGFIAPGAGEEDALDHETAAPLVPALAAGHLGEDESAGVRAHLAACAECRSLSDIDHAMRTETARYGAPLFSSHPESADLVSAVLLDGRLDADARRSIAEHMDLCASCRREATLLRGATAPPAPRWWHRLGSRPVLVPAMGALLVALAFPAYRGLVDMPRVGAERSRAADDLRHAEERIDDLDRRLAQSERDRKLLGQGGVVTPLYLLRPTRADWGSVPEMSAGGTAALQPILVAFDPLADPTRPRNRQLTVAVRRLRTGEDVWQVRSSARALSDTSFHTVTVLVPRAILTGGDYELVVRDQRGRIEHRSHFRVTGG